MNRRAFLKLIGTAALAPSMPTATSQPEPCPTRLVLSGDGNGHTTYKCYAWFDRATVMASYIMPPQTVWLSKTSYSGWERIDIIDPAISPTQSIEETKS